MSIIAGLEEFVTIVDEGSVSAAAELLQLPRPTLSRRLARLEEKLGVRLIHRTTRRMNITPQGEILYARARRLIDGAREAENEIRRLDGVPRGHLRISVPIGMPRAMIVDWTSDFIAKYPEVSVEFSASSSHVDLVAEGFDLAIRAGEIKDTSLVARHLATNPLIAVVSPDYLKKVGTPTKLKDLSHCNCITGHQSIGVQEKKWPLLDGTWVEVSGNLCSNEMTFRVEAAKRGMGVVFVVQSLVEDELANGELVHILPELVGRIDRVHLVYADREFLDPKIRAFIDFFVDRLSQRRSKRET